MVGLTGLGLKTLKKFNNITSLNGGVFFYPILVTHWLSSTYIMSIASTKENKHLTKIAVSFKNTTKDQKLFAIINAMEEKSEFIKRACEEYLKNHS